MGRKALLSGTVVSVIIFVIVLAVTIGIYAVYKAPGLVEEETPVNVIPDDFEPFRGETIREQVEVQTVENRVAGMVTHALYTIKIRSSGEEFSLMEALRLYAYCGVDGRESVHRCSNYPGREEIETAVRQGMNEITGTGPGESKPYAVEAEYRGSEILHVGEEVSGSSFVFLGPLPGGRHVKLTLSIALGQLSTGVVR